MSAATIASYKGALSLQGLPEQPDENATVVAVGLDFGPTWISTSFSIAGSGDFSNGFPCGPVYRDFYQEALSKKVQSHLNFDEDTTSAASLVPTEERALELVQAFARHIEEARLMGVWALDNNPMLKFEVMAITIPDHWDVSARTVVAKAAKLTGQPLDGSHMILKLPRAVQSAYEMHEHTAGKHLALLVHNHKSHLHLMLVQMCGSGFVMKRQVYLSYLGEDTVLRAYAVDSAVDTGHETLSEYPPGDDLSNGESTSYECLPNILLHDYPLDDTFLHGSPLSEKPLIEDPLTEGGLKDDLTPEPSTSTASLDDIYSKTPVFQYLRVNMGPIQEALRQFLQPKTVSNDSNPPSDSSLSLRHAVLDVRYIVIDGDATSLGQEALRRAIEELFADMDWINIEGDMADWGAKGAKIAAQVQLENPQHLGDWKDLPGYLPEKAT